MGDDNTIDLVFTAAEVTINPETDGKVSIQADDVLQSEILNLFDAQDIIAFFGKDKLLKAMEDE